MAPAGVDGGGVAHLDNGRKVDNDGETLEKNSDVCGRSCARSETCAQRETWAPRKLEGWPIIDKLGPIWALPVFLIDQKIRFG